MKLDNLKEHWKNKKELVPTVLLGVSVLCGILILVKVTSFFMASARAESVVKRAIRQNQTDPNNINKQLASSAAITAELKKNNLFAPPQAKQHPVKEVSGIFGDQVLIENKWYGVGEKVGDAKIIAIGPTSVTIMWDGKEQSFLPIQAAVAEAQNGPRGRTAKAEEKEGEAKGENPEESSGTITVQIEGGGPEFGGRGGGPEFGDRGGPGEGFMAMRQRFENMSEEERQAFRDRMRERFAGGRGGPGRGRGGPGGRDSGGR